MAQAERGRAALAALLVLLTAAGLGRVAVTEILNPSQTRASDALPLYLSAATVSAGRDPTVQAELAAVYDARQMDVGAATFSTLYPATAGWVLQPWARLDWEGFTLAWRWMLLASIAAFPVAAGLLAGGPGGQAGQTDRWLWGGLVGVILAWHPVSAECVRLGQVNMLLGACCALAIAAVVRGPSAWVAGAGGLALALGGLIKLVPGALLLPLLAARRPGLVAAAAAAGGLGLALTAATVPAAHIAGGILDSLRFQGTIDPDWLVGKKLAPDWVRWIGFVRHEPMQWITLGLAGAVPWLRPSRGTAAAGMALICAWLGADAAGFHILYAPLFYPALVLLIPDSPWRAAGLTAVFYALAAGGTEGAWLGGVGPEPRMVLAGVAVWGAALWRLLSEAARVPAGPWEQEIPLMAGGRALAGVATGALLAGAWPDGDAPVAAPLPEGQEIPDGPGFIHPDERVPGMQAALGDGLDRSAPTLLKKGTVRAVQVYLRRAPLAWEELAARYPARAEWLRARARAAPVGELRDHSGRTIRDWLIAEREAMDRLSAEGLSAGEFRQLLEEALACGLTDPDIEQRIRDGIGPAAPLP